MGSTLNMPKNKGKGGKNRRRGKNEKFEEKRELEFKMDGQEYAQVKKMLGNGRLEAFCFDGKTRLAIIRGKMRKKVWVNQGDIILLGLRDFQDDKADVIQKYSADEARNLKETSSCSVCATSRTTRPTSSRSTAPTRHVISRPTGSCLQRLRLTRTSSSTSRTRTPARSSSAIRTTRTTVA